MKIIGLIGGMSYVSTIEYYKIINQEYAKLFGKFHSPRLILTNVDFNEVVIAMHTSQWEVLSIMLTEAVNTLDKAGANFAIICCNSAHTVFSEVQDNVQLPMVHILEPIGRELVKQGIKNVGILGTKFVMEALFYKEYLYRSFDIQSISPNVDDQHLIHQIIYNELCLGERKITSKKKIKKIIEKLKANGAEAIVLGCTELSMLVSQKNYCIPIMDTTKMHAKYALHQALVLGNQDGIFFT